MPDIEIQLRPSSPRARFLGLYAIGWHMVPHWETLVRALLIFLVLATSLGVMAAVSPAHAWYDRYGSDGHHGPAVGSRMSAAPKLSRARSSESIEQGGTPNAATVLVTV